MNFNNLKENFIDSFKNPSAAINRILKLGLTQRELLLIALLITITSTILSHVSFQVINEPQKADQVEFPFSPFTFTLIQFIALYALSLFTYWVTRFFRGNANFIQTITVIIWLSIIMQIIQIVQLFLIIVFPSWLGITQIFIILLFMILFSSFIAHINGFKSAFTTGAITIAILFGFSLMLAFLLVIAGFVPDIPPPVPS